MSTVDDIYKHLCNTPSDINEHLPTLKEYAEKCSHVTEMGVRHIVSTWALLAARPERLVAIDLQHPGPNLRKFQSLALQEGVDFVFWQANTLGIELEETDLLFIDTLHQFEQLERELSLHGDKAQKYLIFHDTETFGRVDEFTGAPNGLMPAIEGFLKRKPHWVLEQQWPNNNGLTVLRREG